MSWSPTSSLSLSRGTDRSFQCGVGYGPDPSSREIGDIPAPEKVTDSTSSFWQAQLRQNPSGQVVQSARQVGVPHVVTPQVSAVQGSSVHGLLSSQTGWVTQVYVVHIESAHSQRSVVHGSPSLQHRPSGHTVPPGGQQPVAAQVAHSSQQTSPPPGRGHAFPGQHCVPPLIHTPAQQALGGQQMIGGSGALQQDCTEAEDAAPMQQAPSQQRTPGAQSGSLTHESPEHESVVHGLPSSQSMHSGAHGSPHSGSHGS